MYDPSHYKNSLTKFDEPEASYSRAVQSPPEDEDEPMHDTHDKEISYRGNVVCVVHAGLQAQPLTPPLKIWRHQW